MADSVKIRIEGDDSPFKSTLSGLGGAAKSAFTGISAAMDVVSTAATAAGVAALKTGSSFSSAMSEVQAISGATAADMERLTQVAKDYGASTSFSASECADALKYMSLAGWDANQSIEALGGVLNLAAASGMELGAASDMVTDYMSAFGMEASKSTYFADMLSHAQSTSNTTAEALGEAYRNCAANLNAAGQDVETVTSLLMGMANQGLKGSVAGTALTAMMRDIGNSMKDGAIQIGNTSVAVADAQGNYRDLTDILIDVNAAVDGMGTAERAAALASTFTADSIKGMNLILNEGVDNISAYEQGLRGAAGAAQDMADTMLDNLSGDITMFKSALEGLQITAFEGMEAPARKAVQMATEVVSDMDKAYQRGGIDGLMSYVNSQIPKLTTIATNAATKMLNSVTKKLPELAKGLLSNLPDIFGGAMELAPQLTDALFEVAGVAVESLVGQLPTLVPQLLTRFGKTLLSAGNGIGRLIESLFNGIGTALKSKGLMAKNLNDVIQDAFDGVDTSGLIVRDVDVGTVTVDGEVDTSAYKQKIETAVSEIKGAIAGLNLSEAEQTSLEQAIMKGSGAEALTTALESLGVDEATAQSVASKIESAMNTIHSAFSNIGLDEGTTDKILEYVAAGHSVEEALQVIAGLDPETAKTKAAEIQPALDEVSTSINDLDLEGVDTSTLLASCSSVNAQIAAALKMLGADDETISAALTAMDTLSSSVSTQVGLMFENLKTAFTNGIAGDDQEAAATAQTAMDEYAAAVESKIDTWAAEAKAQLESMGLTATDLATKTAEIDASAASMKATLDGARNDTAQWISDNADAATSVVQANLDQLDGILATVEDLEARIETLRASLSPAAYATRNAVEMGGTSNARLQAEAIQLTFKEHDLAVNEALEKNEATLKEAQAKLTQAEQAYYDNVDKYGQKRAEEIRNAARDRFKEATKDADKDYATAVANADEAYNAHMQKIMQGMILANSALAEQLNASMEDIQLRDMARAIRDRIIDAVGSGEEITLDELLSELNITSGDMDALAQALDIDSIDLGKMLTNALSGGNSMSAFNMMETWGLTDYAAGVEKAIIQALEGIDLSDASMVLQKALEEGWITGTENIDWSDPQAVLRSAIENYLMGEVPEIPITVPMGAEAGDVNTDGLQEQVQEDVEEAISEPVEATQPVNVTPETTITEEEERAGVQETVEDMTNEKPIETTQPVNVNTEVTVTESEGSSIQDAVEAELESQTMSVGIQADVILSVNVSDSNAGEVGQAAGGEISSGIASGISAGSGAVQGAAHTTIAAATTAARSGVSTATGVGRNFSAGLASGILAGRSGVISAAISVAQAAIRAAKAELDEHSPSKVTEEMGEFYDTGFAKGILNKIREVSNAGVTMARAAVSSTNSIIGPANFTPRITTASLSGALGDAVQGIADIESGREIALYLNGKEMGRVMATDNARAASSRNRSIALGYGK